MDEITISVLKSVGDSLETIEIGVMLNFIFNIITLSAILYIVWVLNRIRNTLNVVIRNLWKRKIMETEEHLYNYIKKRSLEEERVKNGS